MVLLMAYRLVIRIAFHIYHSLRIVVAQFVVVFIDKVGATITAGVVVSMVVAVIRGIYNPRHFP